MIICDTNVLIDLSKGVERVIEEVRLIQEKHVAISVITASELVYGALNKRELEKILRSLAKVQTLHLNDDISKLHLKLLAEFSLSHDLNLPDALIAATAIHYDLPLFTLNRKDFHYLPKLKLYQPSWVF